MMKYALQLALLDDTDATFVNDDTVTVGLALSLEQWALLGKPHAVTVTVAVIP